MGTEFSCGRGFVRLGWAIRMSFLFAAAVFGSAAFGETAADPTVPRRYKVSDAELNYFNGSVILGDGVLYSLHRGGEVYAESLKTGAFAPLSQSTGFHSLAWAHGSLFGLRRGGSVWVLRPRYGASDATDGRWICLTDPQQTVRAIYAMDDTLVALDHLGTLVRYDLDGERRNGPTMRAVNPSEKIPPRTGLENIESQNKPVVMKTTYFKDVRAVEPFLDVQGRKDAKIIFADGTVELLREGLVAARKLESFRVSAVLSPARTRGINVVYLRGGEYGVGSVSLYKPEGPYEVAFRYRLRTWGASESPVIKLPTKKVAHFITINGTAESWSTDVIRSFFSEIVLDASEGAAGWVITEVK